jgi:chromosome segregation ATPase
MAEDAVSIAGSEDAEDVHGLSPELGDHANALRQNKLLRLIQEAMAISSHRSNEQANGLIQAEQQLEILRDRQAQLEERVQNTNKEINELHKEIEKLQAESQATHDQLKKLEQAAKLV